MISWRLSGSGRVAVDENQGQGGGRWHSPGRSLLYTADSCATAVVEFLVHLTDDPPPTLVAVALEFPDVLPVDKLSTQHLPDDWRSPGNEACRTAGDKWLDCPFEERAAVLRVPSAVIPQQRNWLIDPRHPDAARIRILSEYAMSLDPRLLDPQRRG